MQELDVERYPDFLPRNYAIVGAMLKRKAVFAAAVEAVWERKIHLLETPQTDPYLTADRQARGIFPDSMVRAENEIWLTDIQNQYEPNRINSRVQFYGSVA